MKKILIALMAIMVTIGLAGLGTFAYFTDTAESEANILEAGELAIEVGQEGAAYWNIENIKPGDEFSGSVLLTNTGTLPISNIMGQLEIVSDVTPNRGEAGGFSDMIGVSFWGDSPEYENYIDAFLAVWDSNEDGILSLAEMEEGWPDRDPNYNFSLCNSDEGWGEERMELVYLAPGQSRRMRLDMFFIKTGDQMNEYQNAELEFKIKFMALQVGAPLPSTSDETSPSFW